MADIRSLLRIACTHRRVGIVIGTLAAAALIVGSGVALAHPMTVAGTATATSGRWRYTQPSTVGGALISGVVAGGPAAAAGLTAGDAITAVDGTTIDSPSALTETLAGDAPGQAVTITWTDSSSAAQSASVTLINGPAA